MLTRLVLDPAEEMVFPVEIGVPTVGVGVDGVGDVPGRGVGVGAGGSGMSALDGAGAGDGTAAESPTNVHMPVHWIPPVLVVLDLPSHIALEVIPESNVAVHTNVTALHVAVYASSTTLTLHPNAGFVQELFSVTILLPPMARGLLVIRHSGDTNIDNLLELMV